MIIAGLDLETTGLLTPDHRIIEVYIGLWRDGKKVYTYEQRIDPQRAIAADAQAVHHISYADVAGKPTFKDAAPAIAAVLSKADLYVAHNGDEFDLPFLRQEFARIGVAMPERPSFDTMLEGLWATHDGKKPRLQELCFACGLPYDPALAHAASYDVERMMECFFAASKWGFFNLPPSDATLAA